MKLFVTKKLILFAAMLLVSAGNSFAFEDGGLTYRVVDNNTKTVKVSYQGDYSYSNPYTQSSIVIPPTVDYNGSTYTVVEIGQDAFNMAALSSIVIPTTVKTVGNGAFRNCRNLTTIDLSTIENFGNEIFVMCSNLTSVKLPETLQSIPDRMFIDCSSLTSFDFPETITEIGSSAFANTGLTSVTISCDKIGMNAFGNCSKLTKVKLLTGRFLSNIKDIFWNCDNIETIVCLARTYYGQTLGFTYNVKENATVYVPQSQIANWSSDGFLNVKEADISTVGGHVLDVYPPDSPGNCGKVYINGEYASDWLYGNTFVIEPGADVEVKFESNGKWVLDCFTLNGTDMTNSVVNDKYTIKNVSSNQSIKTTWKEGVMYTLSTSFDHNNGSVFVNGNQVYGGSNQYLSDKDITILLKPNNGYVISNFQVNNEEKKEQLTDNGDGTYSYSFKIQKDTYVNIYFAKKWTLTTTFNDGGTVTIDGENVVSGTIKEIIGPHTHVEINANSDYEIISVLHNGVEKLSANLVHWDFWPGDGQGDNQTLDVTFQRYYYTLTYMVDDVVYKSVKLRIGDTIYPEPAPQKEGYTFSGWIDLPTTMPNHDVTVIGSFTINKYKLTYKVDGIEYKTYEIEYGATIIPEPEPTKEGYTFSGWIDLPATMPAHDVVVISSFTINKYKLIYQVDGVEYKTIDIEYGATITPEPAPTKEGYSFSGWIDIPATMPAHDVTVTGTFTINKYMLTYVVDGDVYKSSEIEYGATITPEPDPTKEGYTFSGWSDIPATMPAHDVTVTGTFTKDGIVVDGVTFEETGDGVVLADGGNLSGDVTIPATITANGQTYSVTGIGDGAFKGNTTITSITISEGITRIGAEAFEGCTNLKEIIIGRDVTAIADKAFADIVPSASAPRRADGAVLTVSCYAVNVPQTAENAFENTPIDNALLLVNDDIINEYCNAEPWKSFGTIQGFNGGSGINAIWANGDNAKIYTIDGKQLERPQKGLNIVRMSDGTVKKIVVSRQ